MCSKHWTRVKRYGDPYFTKRHRVDGATDWEKFWAKVIVTDECWGWRGAPSDAGYATIHLRGSLTGFKVAHRWLWEQLYGPLPDCLELDHLCRNRICTNPDHLEPVTHLENVRRGVTGEVARARQLVKTHCPQGHAYDEINAHFSKDGRRYCRACSRESMRQKRAVLFPNRKPRGFKY